MPALIEGKPVYIQGSGAKPYELKNVGGVYSCSCPSWRNAGGQIDTRTCKHLRKHCGDAAEFARIAGHTNTEPAAPKVVTADIGDAQRILTRAASQGRKLRQDEKAKLHGPPVLLAHSFEDFDDLDPTGWLYSEKLDGVRAWWNGTDFISRQGNVFHAPAWFKAGLPAHLLDGELWIDRGKFQATLAVVRRLDGGDMWKAVKYVVYDAPHLTGSPFEERLEALGAICRKSQSKILKYHPHYWVKSRRHLLDELKAIASAGGEGLMIRKPGALYEAGRSSTLLKVKPFSDAEAVVIGYDPGKGRHKGRVGALRVRMPNGKEFSLGAGLTDDERRDPPKIGVTITYRYTGLTDAGIPKCTGYICVRDYE